MQLDEKGGACRIALSVSEDNLSGYCKGTSSVIFVKRGPYVEFRV